MTINQYIDNNQSLCDLLDSLIDHPAPELKIMNERTETTISNIKALINQQKETVEKLEAITKQQSFQKSDREEMFQDVKLLQINCIYLTRRITELFLNE